MNPISEQIVPTNFKIPAGIDNRWVFVAGPVRAEIKTHSADSILYRKWLIEGNESLQGFTQEQVDDLGVWFHRISNHEMDWMARTIEHLKYLCSPDEY